MSTVPPAINATPATELHKISAYIKAHERLIILLVCLGVGIHFYSRIIGAWESHDQRVADQAHATLQADIADTKAQADSNAKAAAAYQALAAQLADANKVLAAAQVTRNTATQTQQATDRILPPNELAIRWARLLNVEIQSIQVEPGGKGVPDALLVTPATATETVVQLESVPTLQADLKDEETIAANEATQITSLAGVNVGLNKQIDALNIENVAEINACTDDKNLLKAKARKSKFRWFLIGAGVGWFGRQAVKTYTGF